MTDKLVALCDRCKCCLAHSTHCWVCHTTKGIKELCGDDLCEEKVKDYLARQEMQKAKRMIRSDLSY